MEIRFTSGAVGIYHLQHLTLMNHCSHQLHHIRHETSPAMGASPQFVRLLFSAIPLAAGSILFGNLWGVSQMHRKEVEVEQSTQKILAN
jgi:hypothetical protein